MKEGHQNIKVVARLRPLNNLEMQQGGECCVQYNDKQISVLMEKEKVDFSFDKIFGPDSQQIDIYEEVAIPILQSVMNGYNGTIFAYGQTSSGKTHTMEVKYSQSFISKGPDNPDDNSRGLIPRVMDSLFEMIQLSEEGLCHIVKVSFMEIYNEKINDLIDPSKVNLQIKEDRLRGIFVNGLTERVVQTAQEMKKVIQIGSLNRTIAATRMNERSSRSHSIFQIHVSEKNLLTDSSKSSKLYFVDLAGSEKISKTNVTGQQLEEAKNINKSLTCLGMVINALSDKKEHIPYRDSKLTRILSESIGGNAKTTLIVACSMCSYNDKETISTLRFGQRAKSIKNRPIINAEKSSKELQILLEIAEKKIIEYENMFQKNEQPQVNTRQLINLQEEIEYLKTELAASQIQSSNKYEEYQFRIQKYKQNEEQLRQQIQDILKLNSKLLVENEQIKQHVIENEQIIQEIKRSILLTKQDLNFFLLNFQIKNQFISDTESTREIFMTEQYDKDVEERTYNSILRFQEAITQLDKCIVDNKYDDYKLPSQNTSKLGDIQSPVGFFDDMEDDSRGHSSIELKIDDNLEIKDEIDDVENLLVEIGDMEQNQIIEIINKMRNQIIQLQDKYKNLLNKLITVQDQHQSYVLQERYKLNQLKQLYNKKKESMQQQNKELMKQLEDISSEYSRYRSDQEKQVNLLTQTNQSLISVLDTQKQLQQSQSTIQREFILECTIKQLMQERNELSNTLQNNRQQIEQLIQQKQNLEQKLIKQQLDLNMNSKDEVKAPTRLKDGISTQILKMMMQGKLQDQSQIQELMLKKQQQVKEIQNLSFRKQLEKMTNSKEASRNLMIQVQSLIKGPQFSMNMMDMQINKPRTMVRQMSTTHFTSSQQKLSKQASFKNGFGDDYSQ